MSTTYPVAVDALTNPLTTDSVTSPSHATQHANANDAIEAIETYLGTNASLTAPGASARVLRSTSATASNWAQLVLTTDVTGVLPIANGGTNASTASITSFNNITGLSAAGTTGTTTTNLVFSTSPVLVTPALGTPASGVLTSCTGLPAAAVVAGTLGTGSYVMDTMLFIGDTSNANMTVGLTINQGGADNEIIALKSSDVVHGITDNTETDTYGLFTKLSGASGGISMQGYSEVTSAMQLYATHTTDDTTKSTAGVGVFNIQATLKSGTGATVCGADANLLVIRNNTTTRFIFDADGDSHQDVGTAWTNFDTHDDIALLNILSAHVTRKDDPLREGFGKWLQESKEPLEKMKLVTFNEDGHHFMNMSRLQMLTVGAVRQLYKKLEEAYAKIGVLEQKLLTI